MGLKVDHHGENERVGCEGRECLQGENAGRGHLLVSVAGREQEMGYLVEQECWCLNLEDLLSLGPAVSRPAFIFFKAERDTKGSKWQLTPTT